jgi:hypothetical protein
VLGLTLACASLAHLLFLVLEHVFVPSPTLHHELAVRAIRYGPFRRLFWFGALGFGGVLPLVIVAVASMASFPLPLLVPAAFVALAGSVAWGYIWVEAGQAVPNS